MTDRAITWVTNVGWIDSPRYVVTFEGDKSGCENFPVYRLSDVTPGMPGTSTGLKDRNGRLVLFGDRVEFDAEEWGGEMSFTVEWDADECSISVPGVPRDSESYWTVLNEIAITE